MQKRLIILFLLLLSSFWFMNCAAEAEESQEDTSEEELLVQNYLMSTGLIGPSGIFWEGSATIDSCIGTTIDAGLLCGTLLADGAKILQDNADNNFYVSLDGFVGGVVSAKMYIIAPHFNAVPYGYLYQTQGGLSLGQNDQYNILTLSTTSVLRNDNTGYDITFASIRFEDRPVEGLVGSATAVLSSSAVNGDAVLVYKIAAKKTL